MPITRVPVLHKFGIISHSQRLELQERLLKQTYLQTIKSKNARVSQRNPLEVTEHFVYQFNHAEAFEDKQRCEEMARKMLERAKRRAGIRNSGSGNYVNLPLAWTELAQLAQCKGHIQEECLDVLIASLDVSPLAKYHIPALFFLAETMLYWLRTDAVHQPYLRAGEIKLLKMGHLVFQRLFYHHMAGQLQGHSDFKNRLFTYTEGLGECQEAYNPYPNALLSIRFIIEVSKIILTDAIVEPGEVKEGDNLPHAPKHNLDMLENATREIYEREAHRESEGHSSQNGAISSSVHDLSPTLWHALDVWRCTKSLSGGFREALNALAHCGLGLASETWVDGTIALNILAETAKTNLTALKVLLHLAHGIKKAEDLFTPPLTNRSENSDVFSFRSNDDDVMTQQPASGGSDISSKDSPLSNIYEHSDDGDKEKKLGSSVSANNFSSATNSTDLTGSLTSNLDSGDKGQTEVGHSKPQTLPVKSREVSFDETTIKDRVASDMFGHQRQQISGSQGTSDHPHLIEAQDLLHSVRSGDFAQGTGLKADIGSDFYTSRGSDASSAPTYTNLPSPEMPGINGWHWEVAFTYTDMLADICIYGNNATIQKTALIGSMIQTTEPGHHTVTANHLLSSGLLDLTSFHALNESADGGPNDWSWRIRYGAIQALVKVVRSLTDDKARRGLCTAAWHSLMRAQSAEKDGRVLEALKVGQVHTNIQGILGKVGAEVQASIGGRIAAGLSSIYLPPLPAIVDMTPRPHTRQSSREKPQVSHRAPDRRPLRTSLKEEIDLAMSLYEPPVNFNTRTSFDLRRIVEDQWRKDMQKQLEEEEEDKRREQARKQKEEEATQRQRELNKVRKLQQNRPPLQKEADVTLDKDLPSRASER